MNPIFLVNGIFPAYYGGNPGFTVDQITENLAYIIDGAGWKLFKRNGVSTALIPVETVSGVGAVTPHIEFTAKKIPYQLIEKVVAFFKAIYQKYQSEAVGYLYYELTTGNWDYIVPKQSASAAHASYQGATQRAGWQCAGTIHSHASMSAFHSGTDDKDEASFDGVHITIGKVSDLNSEFSCSLVIQGKREKFEIWDLVDGFPRTEAPTEWVNSVKLSTPYLFTETLSKQAEDLYAQYFNEQISEVSYLAELKKIEAAEKKSDAERLSIKSSEMGFGSGKKNSKKQVWPRPAIDDEKFHSHFLEGGER